MSNMYGHSHKVISIKKFTEIFPEDNENEKESQSDAGQVNSLLELNHIKQEITDLTQQKENMLEELRKTIDSEKQEWLAEKEEERKEAQQTGYEAGYTEGVNSAQNEWSRSLTKINELTDLAKEDYFRTIDKHEDAIVQLAISSAEKIINNKISEDPQYFTEIVQQAIKEVKDFSYIHLYVHPDEYEHVLKQKAELEQIVDANDLISIYADSQLNAGDCIIKHPNGQIDAGIDLQLRQIKNLLAEKIMEQSE